MSSTRYEPFSVRIFQELIAKYDGALIPDAKNLNNSLATQNEKGDLIKIPFIVCNMMNPLADSTLSVLYVYLFGRVYSDRFVTADAKFSEVYVIFPGDIHFFANVQRGWDQADRLNETEQSVIWKYIRFKLRNGTRLIDIPAALTTKGTPASFVDDALPHTINMDGGTSGVLDTPFQFLTGLAPFMSPLYYRDTSNAAYDVK